MTIPPMRPTSLLVLLLLVTGLVVAPATAAPVAQPEPDPAMTDKPAPSDAASADLTDGAQNEPAAPPVDAPTPDSGAGPAAIPTPTVTTLPQPAAGETIGGVPMCVHDPRAWHGLVERNADGSIRCTYGHEHKDDPRVLDYAFGPLPDYLGGSISYPFETFNTLTGAQENEAKHNVYGWQVMDLPACVSTSQAGLGFRRARLELHMDGPLGATTRYHSFWLQAETCSTRDSDYRGFVEHGGWIDSGSLFVDSPVCPGLKYVPTGGDSGRSSVEQRLSGSPACPRLDETWYARAPGPANIFTGSIKESWGAVDPVNPAGPLRLYGGTQNGSYQEPFHILSLTADGAALGQGTMVNYDGYTDRYGMPVQGCTRVALNCVPLKLRNVRSGVEYQFRNDTAGLGTREYDVRGPDGQSLIRYPN